MGRTTLCFLSVSRRRPCLISAFSGLLCCLPWYRGVPKAIFDYQPGPDMQQHVALPCPVLTGLHAGIEAAPKSQISYKDTENRKLQTGTCSNSQDLTLPTHGHAILARLVNHWKTMTMSLFLHITALSYQQVASPEHEKGTRQRQRPKARDNNLGCLASKPASSAQDARDPQPKQIATCHLSPHAAHHHRYQTADIRLLHQPFSSDPAG